MPDRPGTPEAGDVVLWRGESDQYDGSVSGVIAKCALPVVILAEADFDSLRTVETAARRVCQYYERVDKDRMSPSLAGFIETLADVLGEGERTE